MQQPHYLIVGSGLTGAVFARQLTDAGYRVVVIESREHTAGNVFDYDHSSGIRVHKYGPHYFRTVSDRVWQFVNRFGTFMPYEARIKSNIGGKLENWPIGSEYLKREIGEKWKPQFTGEPSNFEEAALSIMPDRVYRQFVKEYTEKQWGVPATELDAALCKRFDVRHDNDPRLTPKAKHQGIPIRGYDHLVQGMLNGIEVITNCAYKNSHEIATPSVMTIYTGPIDAYFDHCLGKLRYRGQRREVTYLEETARYQPVAQVNEPLHDGGRHIRTIEWKHLMPAEKAERVRGTVITREFPIDARNWEDAEYPFPDSQNAELYKKYRRLADGLDDVLICGRLGEYKYFDMDHAIARAMTLADRILAGASPSQAIAGDANNAAG